MSGGPDAGFPARVLGIVAAGTAMAAIVGMVAPRMIPVAAPMTAVADRLSAPARPLPGEADVFRTRPGDLAADPGAERRAEAHPRTLALHRRLRAYPGAPPRIPHAVTRDEFRGGRCAACHERGGFVERFAAYAPVAPHPELTECLQCHVPDDALVGIPFGDGPPVGPVCYQCHVLDREPAVAAALDWAPPSWPESPGPALEGAPPPIPHDLQLRGNCLACHMGAAALEEIRTSHPERSACRQCHIEGAAP